MKTVKETSEQLRISEATVYGLVKSGRLRSHRVGMGRGVYRISDSAIEEYLASTLAEPPTVEPRALIRPRLKHIRLS